LYTKDVLGNGFTFDDQASKESVICDGLLPYFKAVVQETFVTDQQVAFHVSYPIARIGHIHLDVDSGDPLTVSQGYRRLPE